MTTESSPVQSAPSTSSRIPWMGLAKGFGLFLLAVTAVMELLSRASDTIATRQILAVVITALLFLIPAMLSAIRQHSQEIAALRARLDQIEHTNPGATTDAE